MGHLLPASHGKDGWGAGRVSLLPTWRRAGPGWAQCLPGCVCQLAPFGHQQGLLGLAGIPGCQGVLGAELGGPPPDHVWVTLGLVPEEACSAPSPGRPPGPASVAAPPAKSATSPVRVSGLGCGWVRSSSPGPRPPPTSHHPLVPSCTQTTCRPRSSGRCRTSRGSWMPWSSGAWSWRSVCERLRGVSAPHTLGWAPLSSPGRASLPAQHPDLASGSMALGPSARPHPARSSP